MSAVPSHDALGLEEPLDGLLEAIREFRRASSVPVTVVIAPESGEVSRSAHVLAEHSRMTRRLSTRCGSMPDVRVVPWREIDEIYPVTDHDGSAVENEAGIPYNRAWYAAAGAWLLRTHIARVRRPHKVIVVDCDDTLWEGTCAEAGTHGVRVAGRHRALQECLLRMRERGMFVCISSKNREADVLEVLSEHEGMLLKPRDIAAMRVNWEAKSRAVASLAAELNVGLDSVIFIDNNPVECAEVAAHCPGVLALTFPDEDRRSERFLRHVWAFDGDRSAGAVDRTSMHRTEQLRRSVRASSHSFRQYLASLQLRVRFTAAGADDLERISDLSRRTNQFNFNPAAITVAELTAFLAQADSRAWVVAASDRFGDYGTVGAVLARVSSDALIVSSCMLSCRVLGRGVERKLMELLATAAAAIGLARVHLLATPTDRNTPALQFLNRLPARKRAAAAHGLVYEIEISDLERSAFGEFDEAGEAAEAQHAPEPENREIRVRRWDERYRDPQWLQNIAEGCSSAQDIAARIWGTPSLMLPNDEGGDLETRIRAVWHAVLGRSAPDSETGFFALGGTSLQLVFVLNQLSKAEGCRLSLSDAYAAPTVRGMVSLIRKARELPAVEDRPEFTDSVLSGAQQPLWFLFLTDRRNATFNVPIALQLRGDVRADLLRQTLHSLVARHAALSTTHELKGKDTLARFRGTEALSWLETDASTLDDTQLIDCLAERAAQPMDLSKGPIVRAELFMRSPTCSVLLLVTHHIAADFDSMILLVEELARTYEGPAQISAEDISPSYADHVRAEAARLSVSRLAELEKFWADELRGAPDNSVVPAATIAQLRSSAGGDSVIVMSSPQTAAAVASKAAELGVSRLLLLMAAYGLFLRQEVGADDLVIGTPVSVRDGAAFARTIGNFVHLIPLRLRLEGIDSIEQAVEVARTALSRTLPAADLPLHRILRSARKDAARGDGVMTLRTTLAMHELRTTWPSTHLLAHGRVSNAFPFGSTLEANVVGLRQQAGHCDVAVDVFDLGCQLAIDVKYSTRRCDRETADRLGQRFVRFMEEQLTTGIDDAGK
ncbi:MAG TPA: HAD-IIIC family phosphatase [Steroidobacteraceae bacterium]|nr:HAD-IIIC family phosphatase [Steroidobacteraceae bacterium]